MILCTCTILLTGCNKKITEGEICEKEFLPERTDVVVMPVVHTNGKTTYTTYIPMIFYYPDRWRISIRAIEKNSDGEYDTAEYYTTEEVYNDCKVGDMFSYEKDRDYEEEPVEKKKK